MPRPDIGEMLNNIPIPNWNREDTLRSSPISDGGLGMGFFDWLDTASDDIPPHGSPARGVYLDKFMRSSDFISGSIFNFVGKLTAIDFHIEPDDTTLKRDMVRAARHERVLRENSEAGEGFEQALTFWLTDYLSQDNGGFFLINGEGSPDGVVEGMPLGVQHLDAQRCVRTGDLKYPIRYQHDTGDEYKIHAARVLFRSSMPSPRRNKLKLGFCAVSRMVQTGNHLRDIVQFEAELMGSRPAQQLLVGKYITGNQVKQAFIQAKADSDAEGYGRYSKTVIVGSLGEAGVDKINLNEVPSGWDKATEIDIAIATIAMALGFDIRELYPVRSAGASRADALIQHIKSRLRGVGAILHVLEEMFTYYLPEGMKLKFEFIDEQQRQIQAEYQKINSERAQNYIAAGVTNPRIERLRMIRNQEMTDEEFRTAELSDGRLSDGSEAIMLFGDKSNVFLQLGYSDITIVALHEDEIDEILIAVQKQIEKIFMVSHNAPNRVIKQSAEEAIAALKQLQKIYQDAAAKRDAEEAAMQEANAQPQDGEKPNETGNARTNRDFGSRVTNSGAQLNQDNGVGSDTQALKQGGYKAIIDDLSSGFFKGSYNIFEFVSGITNAVDEQLSAAFLRGAKSSAIGSLSQTAANRLYAEMSKVSSGVFKYAAFIEARREDGNLKSFDNQVSVWKSQNDRFEEIGKLYGDENIHLEWVYSPGKEHCTDCSYLNGVVKTALQWREAGVEVRSDRLECHGRHCGCRFEETDKPLSSKELRLTR